VVYAVHCWSAAHGLERLRSGVRRAGQALGRLFRSQLTWPRRFFPTRALSRHGRQRGSG